MRGGKAQLEADQGAIVLHLLRINRGEAEEWKREAQRQSGGEK